MNKTDKEAIFGLARYSLQEYTRLKNPNDPWENREVLQVHFDTLRYLKAKSFIEDFDIDKGILSNGKWHIVEVF